MLLDDLEILKTKSALSNGTRIATEEEAAPTITTNHAMDDILDISSVSSQLLSTGSTAETPSSYHCCCLGLVGLAQFHHHHHRKSIGQDEF
jgi:hypothetical protein